MSWITAEADLSAEPALFAFAYDDIESIEYFGSRLKSWWNRDGKTIQDCWLIPANRKLDGLNARNPLSAKGLGKTVPALPSELARESQKRRSFL